MAGNNNSYLLLRERFRQLRPIFEASGFNVWNCTPGSQLVEFKQLDYAEAAARCLKENLMDIDLANERTQGLYDRKDKLKREEQEKKVTILSAGGKVDLDRVLQDEIEKTVARVRAQHAEVKASDRTYQRLVGTDDQWKEVAFSDILVGDRLKVWNDKARKDRMKLDGFKEFTVFAIENGDLRLSCWERSTHINFVKAGVLLEEIKKQMESPR